jgi:hypothetical protein
MSGNRQLKDQEMLEGIFRSKSEKAEALERELRGVILDEKADAAKRTGRCRFKSRVRNHLYRTVVLALSRC